MNALMQTLVQTGSTEHLSLLFDFCCDHEPSLSEHELALQALHHSQWPFLKTPSYKDGILQCSSIITFLCWMHSIPMVESDVSLSSFPLVQLHERWTHDLYMDCPISTLSLTVIMSTLEGLEWLMFSDIFFTARTPEWIHQVRELKSRLVVRISDLIRHESDPDILNIDSYVTLTKKGELLSSHGGAAEGYDSDEEVRKNKRLNVSKHGDLGKYDLDTAEPNSIFLFDVDTMLTNLSLQLFHFDTLPEPLVVPIPSVEKLRTWVFTKIYTLNKIKVVQGYSAWVEKILISESHTRVFQRTTGFTRAPNLRHLLVTKNEKVVDDLPTSLDDIIIPRVRHSQIWRRLGSDSMLVYLSQQLEGTVQAVLFSSHTEVPSHSVGMYRDAFRNCWIAQLSPSERFHCASMTHAYVFLRRLMIDRGISPLVRGVDCRALDTHIF